MPVRLELGLVLAGQGEDLVAGLGVGGAAQGGQQVVGVLAVGDRRGLLLEARGVVAGRRHGGDRAAHVAARADLGGDRGDQALLGAELAQVVLEPGGPSQVADDRHHLDLVHREDHRGGAAAPAELEAGRGERLERDAAAAELRGDEGREGAVSPSASIASRGEARLAVDVVGVGGGDLVGDPPDLGEEVLVGRRRRCSCELSSSWSSSSAAAIAAMLSNTPRFSIRSGNSTSKASSSASITLTLAWEVMPAW